MQESVKEFEEQKQHSGLGSKLRTLSAESGKIIESKETTKLRRKEMVSVPTI